MARSGLEQAAESVTFWHRLVAKPLAGVWSRAGAPPLGASAAPFYAAALAGEPVGDSAHAALVARCLLWCDAEAGRWAPPRLGWYRVASRAFPDDERCVFFVAALCRQGVITDAHAAATAYESLLRPAWRDSRFWGAFDLPQRAITNELAVLYAEGDPVSPERVAAVLAAHGRLAGDFSPPQRAQFVAYLARACREQDRRDDEAVAFFAARFAQEPGDTQNARCLAVRFAERERTDPAACRVYTRLAEQEPGDGETSDDVWKWTVHLARAHVAAGRLGTETLPALRRACTARPGDDELVAACALACAQIALPGPDELAVLENALEREGDLASVFAARGWPFAHIVRSLALAGGRARRWENADDETARALFARAAEAFPDDPALSVFHARALVAAEQWDAAAASVYEKAWTDSKKSDHAALAALGRAFVEMNAAEGKSVTAGRRAHIVGVWETLFRTGMAWPELVHALAQAYTHEDRVSDVALQVWGQVVESEPKNGKLRARLGREWKARGDGDEALRWYRDAAKLLPRDAETQFAAGVLSRDKTGDLAGAEKMLARAVRLAPQHLQAHFALGETLLAQDKKDAAKTVFQTIVDTIDPNHAPTLLHLGKLNLRYDDASVEAAEALFEQAKTLDPTRPETHRIADLYREKGLTQDEQQALETYLKLSAAEGGGDPDARRQLADLYIRRGDWREAETALRQIIALGADDKKTYTLLGEVMIQARAKAA